MAEISAKDVMALRASTGLGMMDCKKALQETGGDRGAAEEWLRKNVKSKMDKRTDRPAGEGRVGIAVADDGRSAAIVELRSETDFAANNEQFVNMVDQVARLALEHHAGDIDGDEKITDAVDNVRLTTGENISFARGHKLTGGSNTMFGWYIHHDGKTGVLIQGEGDVSEHLLREIAMHIAAAQPRPQGVTPDDIPSHVVEKERQFALEQARESGKPEEIVQKIVDGKMRKLYEELALLEQPFVKDPDKKVKDLLPGDASIVAFLRWQVGEEQ